MGLDVRGRRVSDVSGSLDAFGPPTGAAMSPTPSADEAVAIVAAMEALWPKPVAAAPPAPTRRSTAWRFSGRWWTKPVAMRRERP